MKKSKQIKHDKLAVNLRLSKTRLSATSKVELLDKFNMLTKAEILAWIAMFQFYARIDLKSLKRDETCDIIHEGTEDEEMIPNEKRLKEAIYAISTETEAFIENNFCFGIDGIEDMYDFLNIKWEER
ncbi:hypothetical protein [Parabacteroides sp. FAFU027]|uniref:hypothetical protein n=1 Tax=Parabacteroides sp. FAFU027 TaxID=2922715 RepID=UPI001FAEB8AD|nr:hypothetical protein [Parabacteroides sp. FAFU027]